MNISVRNPFENISLDLFDNSLKKYAAIERLFERRMRRLIKRGISFYTLPRIYQWLIVGGDIANLKLSIIDQTLSFIYGKDKNLDRKINELATLVGNAEMFRLFGELLVIKRILECDIQNFKYEESIGKSLPKFDINIDFHGKKVRIDVTHKEDRYPLEDTAGQLVTILEFVFPNHGGDIQYAAPAMSDIIDHSITCSRDMTDKELKQTIENAISIGSANLTAPVSIPCPNSFFKIELKPNSQVWTGGTLHFDTKINAWNSPPSGAYSRAINRKSKQFLKINDNSFKIIGFDYNPGSRFHDLSYYRKELENKIKDHDLLNQSNIDEIVTFSMRFETGHFENLKLLWKRDQNSKSLFMEIIQYET